MQAEESTSEQLLRAPMELPATLGIEMSGAGLTGPIAAEGAAPRWYQPAPQRRVVGLAGPVIGENLLETLLGVIDTVLVAGLGAWAIAGVGSALQVLWFVMAALSALAVGSSVLVAQAYGAGDSDRASRLARQSLLWSVLVSVPLAVGGYWLAGPTMDLFNLEPLVERVGVSYLRITITVIVLVALFIGGGVLRGAGDSRTPMRVAAIANILNVVLAYGLIYGHAGLPVLGPSGSAWATFIARTIALALLLRVLWYGRAGVRIGGPGTWRPRLRVAIDVCRIGIPAAIEGLLIQSAFFMMAIIVAQLGTPVLAAYRISFTALSFSFLPGFGFGVAATVLVGQSVGARQPEEGRVAATIAMVWAVVWMSLIGLVFLLFAPQVMRLFTADPALVQLGASALRVVAFTQPFWAVIFVQAAALRGTGNTRFPMLVTGGGCWVCVVLGWLLVEQLGGGLITIWAAWLVGSPVMALLHWWRFQKAMRDIGGAHYQG